VSAEEEVARIVLHGLGVWVPERARHRIMSGGASSLEGIVRSLAGDDG